MEKVAFSEPRREPSPKPNCAGTLILDFQGPKTVTKKYEVYTTQSGILL